MIDLVFGVAGIVFVVAYLAAWIASDVRRARRRAQADRDHAAAVVYARTHGLPPVPPRNSWRT